MLLKAFKPMNTIWMGEMIHAYEPSVGKPGGKISFGELYTNESDIKGVRCKGTD
jgi:hypothetical protein